MAKKQSLKDSIPSLWHLFGYIAPYMRPQRPLIAGSFLAMFAGVLMRALEPWPLKIVIDYVIVPHAKTTEQNTTLSNLDPLTLVGLSAFALVVIYGLRAYSNYGQKVGFALVGNRVMTQVRTDLYRHIQCLSLAFHSRAKSGDLIVRVIGDIGLLKEVTVTAMMPLLGSVMVIVVMSGLMLWINWELAIIVLLLMPIYWLPTLLIGRRIRSVSRDLRSRESAIASTTSESISAMHVVQTLSLEEKFADQFGAQNQKSLKEGVKVRRLLAKLQGSVQVMTGIATAVVLFYGTVLVLRNDLSAGELLVFLSYLKAAFKPVQDFAKYSGRIAKASAAGERVIQIFETPADVADVPDAITAPTFAGQVCFDQVDYGYDEKNLVLKNLSFSVNAGQRVAIVGPSGAGKSTLIGLLSRLYDPLSGKVMIDGQDIHQLTLASLRAQISVVLQDTLLFATSIEENIAYGAPNATPEDIRQAARVASIHDFIQSLPDKYATQVGERGLTLSGGQRQRIALARAALRQAPILILDEPTSSLDKENRESVLKALRTISEGRTTFMITHELSEIEHADLILYLDDGRIVESGTHRQLLEGNGDYARLIRHQLGLNDPTH